MKLDLSDTIIALATAPGVGAIAVIRLSGIKAIEICNAFFRGKNLEEVPGNTVHFGKIVDEKEKLLDEVLCTVFKAPRSYTKENSIELSCHGSPYIVEQIIQLYLRNGARMANPGEFTLRAFLNGQMDLSQAEAVADLIASDSEQSHELALRQMRGGFSEEIRQLRQELIDFASLIELELDFSEEDVEFADRTKLLDLIHTIQKVINRLINSFQLGNVIKHGVSTAIAGRPNAGKSTLLNALLNEERAIVSDIAGTTRDTIEEQLNIRGIQFRLIDTAGIRHSEDQIEQIGVARSLEKIDESTLVIYVFDPSESDPEALWADVDQFLTGNHLDRKQGNFIFLANKSDLNQETSLTDYYKNGLISDENLIAISAKQLTNLEELKLKLYELVIHNPALLDQSIVSNVRHYEALQKSSQALDEVLNGIHGGLSGDLVAMDIRRALHHLGEITGEISTDDLLDSIFSRFCIGK